MSEELKRRAVGQEDISKVYIPATLSAYAAPPVDPEVDALRSVMPALILANTALNSLLRKKV